MRIPAKSAPPAAATAPGGGAAPPSSLAAPPSKPASSEQVVATVNGENITRGELVGFLNRYQLPPTGHEQIYQDAMATLVNNRLIGQFLSRQQIAVPQQKVNEAIAQIERDFRSSGRGDLQSFLQESGQTMDELRREVTWGEFVKIKATDAELKRFATNHKDLVNGP